MDLEGIMLSEISQTEKDKYTKTKHKTKPKLLDTEDRLKVARGTRKEIGTMGKGSWEAQTKICSYKINKSWGFNVQGGNYS